MKVVKSVSFSRKKLQELVNVLEDCEPKEAVEFALKLIKEEHKEKIEKEIIYATQEIARLEKELGGV